MVRWWPEYSILFVHEFAMRQAANPNIWIGAMTNASNLRPKVTCHVKQSILTDFINHVERDKPYYTRTLEKLNKLNVSVTVSKPLPKPLPKPFETITETHAGAGARATPAPSTEGSEYSEGSDINLSLSTAETNNKRERDAFLIDETNSQQVNAGGAC
jgi:hypothetical protein